MTDTTNKIESFKLKEFNCPECNALLHIDRISNNDDEQTVEKILVHEQDEVFYFPVGYLKHRQGIVSMLQTIRKLEKENMELTERLEKLEEKSLMNIIKEWINARN